MGGKFKLENDDECEEEVDDSELEEYYEKMDGDYESDSSSWEGFSEEGQGSKDSDDSMVSEDSEEGAKEGAEEMEIDDD